MDFSFGGIVGASAACAAAGTVTGVGQSSSYNWWKEVEHANGWYTRYHMLGSAAGPRKGERVEQGAMIGVVGPKYGVSSGPHLHFEVRNHSFTDPIYGTAVDPEKNINNLGGGTTPPIDPELEHILALKDTITIYHAAGRGFLVTGPGFVREIAGTERLQILLGTVGASPQSVSDREWDVIADFFRYSDQVTNIVNSINNKK
ncbi:M23 family metallopeptidase [Mycetocola spongiae]|uniref:M23 family metallopeptidase n=1 Tax=Mycetocola spongiae TaxID=2859226 RepID=UPI001CF219CD|nr:M23 family metallopeptidase [Mycetocola spongiae]UCR88322.1 M23 family metallopeptidase [Mycetocola spongiae]